MGNARTTRPQKASSSNKEASGGSADSARRSFASGLSESSPRSAATPAAFKPKGALPPANVPGISQYPGVAEQISGSTALPPSIISTIKKFFGGKSKPSTTGIGANVAIGRFVGAAKNVENNWDKLTKHQRADGLMTAANAELKKQSVPATGTVVKPLGQRNGELDFGPWNIALNETKFDQPTTTPKVMGGMADTVYHETRHAEQWFRIARLEAAKGKDASEIAQALGIKPKVAQKAHGQPLTGSGKEAKEAKEWYDSIYGKGATARNTTLNNLSLHGTAMENASNTSNALGVEYNNLVKNPKATKEQKQAKLTAWQNAHKAYLAAKKVFDTTYKAYVNLPEEEDAWAIGGKVADTYKKL